MQLANKLSLPFYQASHIGSLTFACAITNSDANAALISAACTQQGCFILTGDADYNNEVDAARVANHKVLLYHSTAVAQTLQGNVDYSEPWQSFLARKSGEQPDTLEDVGFVVRQTTSQATMGSACKHLLRRVQ